MRDVLGLFFSAVDSRTTLSLGERDEGEVEVGGGRNQRDMQCACKRHIGVLVMI